MTAAGANAPAAVYHLRAWPLIYGTLLTTAIAVVLGVIIAVLASIFIVELAPEPLRKLVIPVVRLLASVPSVIYGLIGVLVLVPFVGNHLITGHGEGLGPERGAADGRGSWASPSLILTLMITPIMIALICEALTSVPARVARGRGRARAQPAARDPRRHAQGHPPGDRRRRRARHRAGARRGDHDLDGLGRRSRSRPSRSTGSSSSSSRCARSPRRSSTTTRASARRPFEPPCMRSRCCCCSARSSLSVAGYLIKLPLRKYQTRG